MKNKQEHDYGFGVDFKNAEIDARKNLFKGLTNPMTGLVNASVLMIVAFVLYITDHNGVAKALLYMSSLSLIIVVIFWAIPKFVKWFFDLVK